MATRVTDSADEVITAADAKAHLREDLVSVSNDAYIDTLIRTARHAAEARTGRTLLPVTWRLTFDAFPSIIRLEHPPVTAVTTLKYYDSDGVQQTMDADDYQVALGTEPGRIVPAYGTSWPATRWRPDAVEVVFVAGYANAAAVPLPIVHWMKLAIGEMYANRSRSNERPVVPQNFAEHLLDMGHTVWSV